MSLCANFQVLAMLILFVVPEHNDSTFLVSIMQFYSYYLFTIFVRQYTSPPSALGFWFALEPCTASNGALSFLPGTHFTTDIDKRFVRLPEGGTGFEPVAQPEKPLGMTDATPASEPSYVMETCGAG